MGLRIGILGAGLSGLAAAALLARRGHAVEILERVALPRPTGAGLLLQPPGARVLAEIGVLEAVARRSARVTRLDSRSAGGRRLLDLDYARLGPGLHGLGVARPVIWRALHGAALAAGAAILPGREAVRIGEDAARASVHTADGAARDYDLVVLAAGAHTPLWTGRPGHRSRPYPWGCLWAQVALPAGWPLEILQQRCAGTGVMIGILPTGTGDADRDDAEPTEAERTGAGAGQAGTEQTGAPQTGALYWSLRNDAVAAWREAPLSRWQDAVARAWPEAEAVVRPLPREALHHATYRDVRAEPPHGARLAVIGDAAHGTSPQLGQGTTQALRDALALAEALDAPDPLPARLAAYWRARRARVRYYGLASRALTPVFQSGVPGLGLARDLLLGPLGRLPPVRRQALLTLAGAKTGLFGAEE